MKFRLLRGKHVGANNRMYKAGDVIETDKPLDKLFNNGPGPTYQKFERIHEDNPTKEVVEEPVEEEEEEEDLDELLESLPNKSARELKKLGEEYGVDLKGLTSKSDLIRALTEALEEEE